MAKTVVIFLVTLIGSFVYSVAKTQKSAEFSAATSVLRAVESYHFKTGKLPVSWEEVEEIIKIKQIITDFSYKTKYAFPKSLLFVTFQNEKLQIITMAIYSGSEGNSNEGEEAGRLLLVRRGSGIFEILRLKENHLAKILHDSGHNLPTYTGKSGEWSNLQELNSRHETHSLVPNMQKNDNSRTVKQTSDSESLSASPNDSVQNKYNYFKLLFFAVVLVLICIAITKLVKNRV